MRKAEREAKKQRRAAYNQKLAHHHDHQPAHHAEKEAGSSSLKRKRTNAGPEIAQGGKHATIPQPKSNKPAESAKPKNVQTKSQKKDTSTKHLTIENQC